MRGELGHLLPLVVQFFTFAPMRRPPHGASLRPPHVRPGNGFGRPTRPGPSAWARPEAVRDLAPVDLDTVVARLAVAIDLVLEEVGAR